MADQIAVHRVLLALARAVQSFSNSLASFSHHIHKIGVVLSWVTGNYMDHNEYVTFRQKDGNFYSIQWDGHDAPARAPFDMEEDEAADEMLREAEVLKARQYLLEQPEIQGIGDGGWDAIAGLVG